ncbi:MAG: sensor histidine kinase N-terminal domain-containing protein [Comamonas sp.]
MASPTPSSMQAATDTQRKSNSSLRRNLLLGILLPVVVFIVYNTSSLYRQSLQSINTAYDRSLLASAKVIGEQLTVTGYDDLAIVESTVPYSALEAFEAGNDTRLFYRVSTMAGELIGGFAELPIWRGKIAQQPPYAALVDFYNGEFRNQPVRIAALLQPVASTQGRGMAIVQVAETLQIRESLAREILIATLIKQALLFICIAVVVVFVVRRATMPILQLSEQLNARNNDDLQPLNAPPATPAEMMPLVDSTNRVMARLARLLQHQKRFVRDASHQLRTPLAVLKIQVQSALRGDVEPIQALQEINTTVGRATQLANQMLSLAKVEQLQQLETAQAVNLTHIVRDMVIELSPLLGEKNLQFELQSDEVILQSHPWMLRELVRNLLHNAIQHSPPDAPLQIAVHQTAAQAFLRISDWGSGVSEEMQSKLAEPFMTSSLNGGSGLGLAICQSITTATNARLQLQNRYHNGVIEGFDAVVEFAKNSTTAADSIHHHGPH